MNNVSLETSVIAFGDRHVPIDVFAENVRTLAESGVVDDIGMSDQMNSFFPPSLWTEENTPLATILPDPDSYPHGQSMLAYAAALAPESQFSIMTDAIRNPPSELVQAMLTTANMTRGKVKYNIGGGEIKQCKQYGWKRSQGLGRMEDLFKIFDLFWKSSPGELVSYEGNFTSLKNASLGGAKHHRPQVWGLGGGPKLLDLVTSYCDGTSVATPCVWKTPEVAKEQIDHIKRLLSDKGRNPDDFTFGICCPVLLHEDQRFIYRGLENPLIRWLSAVFGRVDTADWQRDGLNSPWPDGWNYFMKLVPMELGVDEVKEVLSKTTRAHVEKSVFYGSPKTVAEKLYEYVEVGASWVQIIDYLPMTLPLSEGKESFNRTIEVCRHLKNI